MSNYGKVTKFFYSKHERVTTLAQEAIQLWQYGYGKTIEPYPKASDDNCWNKWFVELIDLGSDESNKTIIDAYLHLGCGFSYVDFFQSDIDQWIEAGDEFQTLTIVGKFKELSYDLYHAIETLRKELYDLNREIRGIIFTSVGKQISCEDFGLFNAIIRSTGVYSLVNGCHFDSDENVYVKLHVATGSKGDCIYTDKPSFLNITENKKCCYI